MKLRIFLIDDEDCILETLSYFLNKLGHEVVPASSANFCRALEAPETCRNRHPHCGDILLIDQNMPGLTGIEFIARQHEAKRQVAPVVTVMSANLDHEQTRKATEMGCEILAKPLTYAKLIDWLATVADKIPAQRQFPPREELCCNSRDSTFQ